MEPGELLTTTLIYEPIQIRALFISQEVLRRAADDLGQSGRVHFRSAQFEDPQLFSALQGLFASVAAGESPLALQTRFTLCLRRMLSHGERAPVAPWGKANGTAVRRAMECLQARCQDPVDLEDLSALTGLSRFCLVHAFTAVVGIPPHAFQLHVRIERARALLECGMAPSRVAAEVGFDDQSHFNRHFKRIMMVTPGQYARAGIAPAPARDRQVLAVKG